MLRRCLSVTTVQQLLEMKIKPCFQRILTGSHCSPGALWWRSSCRAACPVLTASPVRALVDEPMSIKGHFLPPRSPVTVCARMHSEDGDLWEAFAHYHTHADGTIDLTRDGSVGGSYLGCEPMGLFWGMQPAPGTREGLRLRKKDVSAPYTVKVCVSDGHVCPSEALSAELAAVTAERSYMAPGVRRIDIRQNGIVGTLFLPPGPGPFPAVLDMWGIGGGLPEYRAALLAARGYASLCLAFMRHKDLPGPFYGFNVTTSYFESAFRLLQDHPQVCADRVGIMGLSFGVYISLVMATQTELRPSCLVCICGTIGSVFEMPDAHGSTENRQSLEPLWTFDAQGLSTLKEATLPENVYPGTKVKIEKLTCPLMFIEGEDDLNCSSRENVLLIEETLRAANKSHLLTHLSYPGAGHLIEPPFSPNARWSLWKNSSGTIMVGWGGEPAPHAAAQQDAWKNTLEFLGNNLRLKNHHASIP